MKCTETDCDQPAEYRYQWSWGALGACCGMHQQHVNSRAQQLGAVLALVPIPVARDELAGALQRICDVAVRLRKRIEEGGMNDADTAELGEELARRIRNAPRPFGDTLVAIREVGTTLISHAVEDTRVAQQAAVGAQQALGQLQQLLISTEAQLVKQREASDLQLYNVRTELERAQLRIAELEIEVERGPDPDTGPPPALEPQTLPRFGGPDLNRVEGGEVDTGEPTVDLHNRRE